MKICIRKIYCNTCRTLVSCQEKRNDHDIQVSCSRCNTILYTWNTIRWMRGGSLPGKATPAAARAAKAPAGGKAGKAAPAGGKAAQTAPAGKTAKSAPVVGKTAKSAPSAGAAPRAS